MQLKEISAKKLNQEIDSSKELRLIDVRTPAEFESMHIKGSKNLPLGSKELDNFKSQDEIVFICNGGTRAKKACASFLNNKSSNAKALTGGVKAWNADGYDVTKGKQTVSIERQVRIAAGSLVLTGTLLGVFCYKSLLTIPAFVGAGLVFAGITDSCGMAMVLAKMPWNKSCGKTSSCK